MSLEEWESLCDHCGRCCLNKLEDEDTGALALTSAACNLLDLNTCRCTQYAQRKQYVPECVNLKQQFADYKWLPETCAYRLLNHGKPLPEWHPLITGRPESVKEAGIAVSDFAVKESSVDDLEDYIIEWLA